MDEKFYPMAPEAWKQPVLDFKDLSIMKFPRVLQTLFYLLKYKREEVCERETSKLDFKRTKPYIDEELFDRMSNYQPFGPNDSEVEPYQKLSFLTRNLETISDEQVDEFSIPLGKILRWVRMALDVRTEDVRRRKNIISILKHEREQALKADEDRTAKRQEELDAEKAAWDAIQQENATKHIEGQDSADEDGNPIEKTEYQFEEFNQDDFDAKFDVENPVIEIPDAVNDEVDNDFDLPWSPPEIGE
jgi:hypothetical protein